MTARFLTQRLARAAAAVLTALVLTGPATAQVNVTDPNLPVVFPDGVYRTPDQVHAQFNGPGLVIILTNVLHQPFGVPPVVRIDVGADERETFSSEMTGLVSVNGSPFSPATGSGPVDTMVFGKVGHVTGTFQTEMLSMSLTGTSMFGPFMIRESPTLPSLGQTSITDIGGGLYRIDSFFDVFVELSIDGGNSWIPDSQGPARVNLQPIPEPSVLALAGLGALVVLARRNARRTAQPL